MKKIIRLTESDLVNIVRGVLVEQTTTVHFKKPLGGTAKLTNKYSAGFYSLDHTDKQGNVFNNTTQFKPIIDEATEFLKANSGSFIPKVVLTASESIIPNADVEGGTGFKKVGWLSEARRLKIDAYVKQQLKPLLDAKLISRIPDVVLDFVEAETTITPSGGWSDYRRWRLLPPEQQANDIKNAEYSVLKNGGKWNGVDVKGYDADQKTIVKFSIVPDMGPRQCTLNVQIGVHYDNKSIGHSCNHARYEITANGIVLTTTNATVGAGKPYADMNNGGPVGRYPDAVGNDFGGIRKNYFKLRDPDLVNRILNNSSDNDTIIIRARCLSPGYNGTNGCHSDAPHVTVHDSDNILTVDGYPNTNDGELVTLDKCGKPKGGPLNSTPKKSKDAQLGQNSSAEVTPTGAKYTFQAPETGTLTSQQAIQNQVSAGNVKKNADGTYKVLKVFKYNNVEYKPGDQITRIIKSKKEQ